MGLARHVPCGPGIVVGDAFTGQQTFQLAPAVRSIAPTARFTANSFPWETGFTRAR